MNPHLRKKMKKQYSCQLYLLLAALVSEWLSKWRIDDSLFRAIDAAMRIWSDNL